MSTKSSGSVAFGALETASGLTDAEIDAKARALLSELTFDEKLGLMDGDLPFWAGIAVMGSKGGYSSRTWPAGAVPRLGIPGILFSDGPRGIIMEGATTFPVTMARGATWDVDLEHRVGEVIGRELRSLGGNYFGGVCINLLRHPAWGRAQETYGEDSYHLGVLGAALATGVQQHVMACVKHFALNSMENARQVVDVKADDRTLHEVYLPHFKRVIDAGVASVMSAYNSVNGEWAGQNRELLTGILKEMWGFDGFVVTDFINGMRDAKKTALSGQDIEMPFAMIFHQRLKGLVEKGEVPREQIDDAALRILHQEVRFGQGRDPKTYGSDQVGSQQNRALAREVADKSIVLLKNDKGLLPLSGIRRVAVIGRLAATPNTGDGGSSNTRPAYVVTPLEGIRNAFGNAIIDHDDGADVARAAASAKEADVAVLVVGYTHDDEGEFIPPNQLAPFAANFPPPPPELAEFAKGVVSGTTGTDGFPPGGDRARLTLHPRDEELIHAVAAANPRTVVAIMAGSAVITEAWKNEVPAIIMLWYPGMEGGHALGDVLKGRVNPSGRLPCTFPASDRHLPFFDRDATSITYDLWHGYRKLARDRNKAAFPFGFGLSYTTFAHSDLKLSRPELGAGDTLEVTVAVTNTGRIAGDEVVQLYVSAIGSKVERAPRELKAFARVMLAPGETKRVKLTVPIAELAYYAKSGWVIEPIEYEAIAARHAEDEGLVARFSVK